jgi:hypothetical protein
MSLALHHTIMRAGAAVLKNSTNENTKNNNNIVSRDKTREYTFFCIQCEQTFSRAKTVLKVGIRIFLKHTIEKK